MSVARNDAWEAILRQARRVVAAHAIAGDEVDPGAVAAEILQHNSLAESSELCLRLEIYIRRELPAIKTMVADLNATGGRRG